jgi:hypothetical protein
MHRTLEVSMRSPVLTMVVLLSAASAAASAQPPGGALDGPPQAKTAASPAQATVRAGQGAGLLAPPADGPRTREEALAACNMGAVLRLGGGQTSDAIRILIGRGQTNRTTDPNGGAWTRTPTGFALSMVIDGERYDVTPNPAYGYDPFDGWTPPDIAALPPGDSIAPLPRNGVPARIWNAYAEVYRNAIAGMSAPEASALLFTRVPDDPVTGAIHDPSQARWARCTAFQGTPRATPALCLQTPSWSWRGGELRGSTVLMDGPTVFDPQKFPGFDQLPLEDDPRPPIKVPAEVERRRALPPPAPIPPRNC